MAKIELQDIGLVAFAIALLFIALIVLSSILRLTVPVITDLFFLVSMVTGLIFLAFVISWLGTKLHNEKLIRFTEKITKPTIRVLMKMAGYRA